MEPLTTLATATLTVLAPYLTKSAEELSKSVGKEIYDQAKALVSYVKGKFSSDDEALMTLNLYEKNPPRHETALKDILIEAMEKDPKFAEGLSNHLKEIGPYVEVVQKMQKAEDVIGISADEVNSGHVNVDQEIDEAKGVTGATFKRLG